jgi:pimeloyl-ACP methyl ester carboxylesterase
MKLGSRLFLLLLASAGRAAPLEDRFARFDGGKVHYRTGGRGADALVFVHGWACGAESWRGQETAFSERRVIVVELSGHGRSDAPRSGYTLDHFARVVEAVLRDAKVERVVLVGHSMGAPVVGRFAGLFPKKTLGLVLVDGAMRPFIPKSEMDKTLAGLRAGYRAAAPPLIDSWLTPVRNERLRGEIRAMMLATPERAAIGAFESMADGKAYERGPITVPTLAVLAKSHGWSADDMAFFRALAPRLESIVWDGVSHFLMMEKPEEFNGIVREFLAKNGLLAPR